MELNDRIQKYIETLPPAVQGEGGQNTLFEAALKLVSGFDLTAEQVAGYLWEFYNPRCVPPWNDTETSNFIHQCEAAFQKAHAGRGNLLESSGRSQTVKAPALPLVCPQKADGSQTAKRGPVRRFRLARINDETRYELIQEWPDGSKSKLCFHWVTSDCFLNKFPTWNKVKRELLFVYPAPDCSPFMLWYRMDFYPDEKGGKKKLFLPFHYVQNADGTGEFVEGNDPEGRVFPFGVVRFPRNENLIFTEGEKAATCVNDFLLKNRFINITATCIPNGAKAWRDDLKEYFREKNVFVWPDNDQNGTQYAAAVCRSLEGVARSVRTLKEYPPGFAAHDDAVEVIEFYAKQRGKTDDTNH